MKLDLVIVPKAALCNSVSPLCNSVVKKVQSFQKLILIVGLCFFSLNAESKSTTISKIKERAPETIFLRKVESAVRTHDADMLLSFMLPEYKRTQHDEFLEGRTMQFLSEFFWCPEKSFDQIIDVSLVSYKLQAGSKTDYDVVFQLKHNGSQCDCTFGMRKDPNTNVFSIYGAVG